MHSKEEVPDGNSLGKLSPSRRAFCRTRFANSADKEGGSPASPAVGRNFRHGDPFIFHGLGDFPDLKAMIFHEQPLLGGSAVSVQNPLKTEDAFEGENWLHARGGWR